MIRHFCDLCGNELMHNAINSNMTKVTINTPTTITKTGFSDSYELCNNCFDKINNFIKECDKENTK